MMRPIAILLTGLVLMALHAGTHAASPWPSLDLPASMRLTTLGQETTVNGIPMRMQAFTATTTSQKLLEALKQQLGPHLITNQLKGYTVVGQPIGRQGHYLTVQIYPMGEYAKGIVAISQPTQWAHLQSEILAARQQWQDKLPHDSSLLNHHTSRDGVLASEQITYRNMHGQPYNTQHLIAQLAREGLTLERTGPSTAQAQPTSIATQGQLLFFKGHQQQAMATVHEQGPRTVVVLQMDRHQKEAR